MNTTILNDSTTLPAILGGRPAVTLPPEAAGRWPVITEEDELAVLDILRDGRISKHPVARELEREWAAYVGVRHALTHCNGTAALLAAFHSLDLEPGDEILVPTATFWASVLPMLWVGAVPVFCESEPDRLGIDPEDMERRITPRTRAVVVVHLWGMPSKMTEIRAVARRHGLRIIEDASHAHGASWRGHKAGALGDVGVFSLQGDKLAPAGEGGVLLTDDDTIHERAVCLGDITCILELTTPARRFAATGFGVKTRMAPMSAALARSQLHRLDERNARRNRATIALSHRLEPLGFDTFLAPPHIDRVYFEFIVRCNPERIPIPRDLLVEALRAEGCDVTVPRYPLLHEQPFFTEGHWRRIARLPRSAADDRKDTTELPRTESLQHEFIRLPNLPDADEELVEQYAVAFEKVVGHAETICSSRARSSGRES